MHLNILPLLVDADCGHMEGSELLVDEPVRYCSLAHGRVSERDDLVGRQCYLPGDLAFFVTPDALSVCLS